MHDVWSNVGPRLPLITVLYTQRDPLSGVCSQLASKVGAESGDHILLSHKNSTIRQTESPASLGLTTANIIGETCFCLSQCTCMCICIYMYTG